MGGWQPDVTSMGVTYGLPSAGVILGSSVGAATLTNDGSIGALSDRAVASSPLFPSNNTSIINNGSITGFTQLVGGNNSIVNKGAFNLRDFEDTTGAVGGVRDTVRVAIAELGTGANNTFTNNGTLALASVTGATTLLRTGEYLPDLFAMSSANDRNLRGSAAQYAKWSLRMAAADSLDWGMPAVRSSPPASRIPTGRRSACRCLWARPRRGATCRFRGLASQACRSPLTPCR
jgi:hypothetical protein